METHKPSFARLRVLWSFAYPHRRRLLLGLVLGLVVSAAGLATPMVTKWVLDTLAAGGSLATPVLGLLVLLVVGAAVSLWQWILLGTLGEQVVRDARRSVVGRLLRAKLPQVTVRQPGELVTRVTSDTVLLREAAASSVIGLVNGAIMLVGTLALMAVLDLVLLGTTVIAVVVVAALFGLLMPRLAKAQEAAQEQVGRLGALLEGTMRAIRTVKASRAEDRQDAAIGAAAEQSAAHSIRAVRLEATAWTISFSGINLAIIAILGFGAWRVATGDLAVSSLVAFLLYAFGLMGPITELSQNVTALQSGIAAAGRIREVEALEPEAATSEVRPLPVAEEGPLVRFERVGFGYRPDRPVVSEIELDLPRRGQLAIVGPSGAGKTTLVSLLLRFVEPEQGRLLLDSRPYQDFTPTEVRSRIAYVEQETPVLPGTIRENVAFTHPDATEAEIWAALAKVQLTELINELPDGLDSQLNGSTISGGQRQRIALARAILRSPDLLILDEATAQIDALTEAAVTACVTELARDHAVLTIAHRLSTVLDADRIVVLNEGKIRAIGDHRQLLATDELYRELVAALRIAERTEPESETAVAGV
ncbi:ABC transporter ATP-binding protein [Microlunatus parietis]|uniref:ATP-binding cassette subfamily B protein n=1 Tax=Microlunatus parietis TaxID=682979 RepID=A0A7Y9LCL9_9ACTN|nr:ABC transporter ATP-binding protein [Microlunatus parietis]NYE72977.1 ATP-binding cassette subfamily B protein [Microlunatus parietis]